MDMYLGVDLGGTNIAVGVVDEAGHILKSDSTPTINTRHFTEIIKDMAMVCERVVKDAGLSMEDIRAVGVGTPGSVDPKNGVVVYANNLKFDNMPLRAELQKYIDKPVALENDANAAAFGEYCVNGGGVDQFVFITLGTGVGGGIVLNGEIYRGFNGAGGELGHISFVYDGVPCTCGHNGCWEAYASVTALTRQTEEAMKRHPDSLMCKLAQERGRVNGRTSFDAAKQGDAAAQAVVDQYVRYVADGLLSVINIFQPKLLAIGGGISKEGEYLLAPIRQYVHENGYNKYMEETKIQAATLFNDAGIIGAAMAAKAAL